MKEFKGTKGEWTVKRERGYDIDVTNRDGDICWLGLSDFIDETKLANAKLIAAAPDLLEELVTLLSNIDEMGNTGEDMMELRNYLSDARKAINKALN